MTEQPTGGRERDRWGFAAAMVVAGVLLFSVVMGDRKSTRLNSSHRH